MGLCVAAVLPALVLQSSDPGAVLLILFFVLAFGVLALLFRHRGRGDRGRGDAGSSGYYGADVGDGGSRFDGGGGDGGSSEGGGGGD